MDKEYIFNYKDIGGNVFSRKNQKLWIKNLLELKR